MTSINAHFTFHYSQPAEYKFSHDSVFMARRVYEDICLLNPTLKTALDLCAGCGIIGLDLLYHFKPKPLNLERFDFIDIQTEYQTHFEKNCFSLKNEFSELKTKLNFLTLNYETALNDKKFKDAYDLIVCNPPYFLPSQGKLSNNAFKNRCHFFLDSNLKYLIYFIEYSLAQNGSAYLIFHDLRDHKIDLIGEIQTLISPKLYLQILPSIRKSQFIKISKLV